VRKEGSALRREEEEVIHHERDQPAGRTPFPREGGPDVCGDGREDGQRDGEHERHAERHHPDLRRGHGNMFSQDSGAC